MYSSVIVLLMLLAQPGASEEPCSQLQRHYHVKPTDMSEVMAEGKAVVPVVRGSGGAARAAAALLLVAIRNVLGYRANLNTTAVHLCDLIAISKVEEAAVIAPAVPWLQAGCKIEGSIDYFASVYRPAAISPELRLWAYVPFDSCLPEASLWTFFRNYSAVQGCGFEESKSSNLNANGFFAVLARNESSIDREIGMDLQKRFDAKNLVLQIKFFHRDSLMRKKISELRNLGKSFLFLDEKLWFDAQHLHVIEVQPPPLVISCSTCISALNPISAFRLGNGHFINTYAPPISKIVNNFTPDASDLREILDIETAQNDFNIEDAACSWALNHDKKFQDMISYNMTDTKSRGYFHIRILLCKNDPINNIFETLINYTNFEILNKDIKSVSFKIYTNEIDCRDDYTLKHKITKYINMAETVGVIAWSWCAGVVNAAKVAKENKLPLLLAGPVAPKVPLDPSVHAATGHLTDLISAFHYFLDSCAWSRIAILSDNSAYSKSFFDTLLQKKKLIYREEIVYYKNIDLHLSELQKAEARIILLNTNWNMSLHILCAALKRDMTPANGYQWIARDWRPLECSNNNSWDSMYHYTINFGWQGEHVESGSKELQNILRNLLKIKGSSNEWIANADSSILADALLRLGYGFGEYYQNYSKIYNLRNINTTSTLSQILENRAINGVAQKLKNKDFALENPLVFINKWQGVTAQSVCIYQNNISIDRLATCKTFFRSQLVRDRPNCGTILTGDGFSPRCQDFTIAIVTVFLIFLVTSLYIARRIRLKGLLDRELRIMASLLEIRQRTVSSLDMYLVNRNAIKILHEIGSGTFGRVHFAELQRPGHGTVVVAAKEPRKDMGPTEECEFFHEACVLAPLCHDNIIELVGICIMNGPPTVLMEHAFYLDLKRYLTERKHLVSRKSNDVTADRAIEVSDESLTRLAREAAAALDYLTTRRLVHRDVRAANCLVDKKKSLKLGDFGMARELDVKAPEYATIRRALFPVLWMAPESLQLGVFSFATDIWSLGVLILEMVTLGERPYGDWQPARVLNYVTSGGSPPLPPDVSKQTSSLLHSCWNREAKLRPSASWVHAYLTDNPRALSPALLKPYPPDPPIIKME